MFREFIGKKSTSVLNIVERGAVKKFAEAIGDLNPLYLNEEKAKKSVHKSLIAPPTFPKTFEYGVIPGLEFPPKGLIHGEQVFEYERPLFVGDELYCYIELLDVYEKQGSRGKLMFVVTERNGNLTSGEPIFTTRQSTIFTDKVREGMQKCKSN
jgi:acyl dehydratase